MVSAGAPTVLLFDVDGTLVDTGGAGRRAVERALQRHGAGGTAGFSFAGMTDRAIVRRALAHRGDQPTATAIEAVLTTYLDELRHQVEQAPASGYRALPGVVALLDAAAEHRACAVGLGTGNLRRGAEIKLARLDLWRRFGFGGFGSDAEDRAELLAIGAERGAHQLGVARVACRVAVIGDTPLDVAAGRAIGAEVIAVATGPIPLAELARCDPDHLFPSLDAPGARQALLPAPPGPRRR